MKRVQQGFTLIELMIVVAIIGILAAVAIPQYKDYTSKSKAGSALASLDGLKKAVALCHQTNAGFTDCETGKNDVPAWTATNILTTATVKAGEITATFAAGNGADLDAKTITLTPTADDARMKWTATTTVTAPAVKAAIIKN